MPHAETAVCATSRNMVQRHPVHVLTSKWEGQAEAHKTIFMTATPSRLKSFNFWGRVVHTFNYLQRC